MLWGSVASVMASFVDSPTVLSINNSSTDPEDHIAEEDEDSLVADFFDFGWLQDMTEAMLDLILLVDPIETDRPFPFGRPTGSTTTDLELGGLMDSSFIYFADRAYDYAWLPEGGGIAVMAIILLTVGYMLSGAFEMFKFSPQKSKAKKGNFVVGFVMILLWYPMYLGLIGLVHGAILAFSSDSGGVMSTLLIAVAASIGWIYATLGFATPIVLFALVPFALLAIIMIVRAFLMATMLAFGPLVVAAKYSQLPVISTMGEQVLQKSIPIVLLPAPIAPVMFVLNEIVLSGVSGGIAGVAGPFLIGGVGFTLLFAVWVTFKITSPQLAGAASSLTNIGTAAAVIASGGGGAAAYSAIRGGPAAALARYGGEKVSNGAWGRDGSRD